jgi:arginase
MRQGERMWSRDLDLLVPLWQGGDDERLRPGAEALGRLTPSAPVRHLVPVPLAGSGLDRSVLHRLALDEAFRAQLELLGREDPERLLTLGGDCSVEVASISHLSGRHGPRLFVLWIDAHADLNNPGSSPSGTAHGMPLRLLLDGDQEGSFPSLPGRDPLLTPQQVALVGTRDLDEPEADFIRDHHVTVLDVATLSGSPAALADLPPVGAAVYVHVDLDVIDPLALPAVAVPTPGGLSPDVLAQALETLRQRHDIVGVGITEYLPQLGHDRSVLDQVLTALGLNTPSAQPSGQPTALFR